MQPLSTSDIERDVLTIVHIGMPVFDKENHKIGNVERVHQGSQSGDDPLTRPLGITQAPEETQQRIMREGYIQIYDGLLWPDRVATPDQIASITDEGIHLNVIRDNLVIL